MQQKLGFILANYRMKLEIELRSFEKKEKDAILITSKKCENLWNGFMILFLLILIGLFIPVGKEIKSIYEIIVFILFLICFLLYLKEKNIYNKGKKREVFLKKRLEEIRLVMGDLEKNNKDALDLPFTKEEASIFLKQLYEVDSIKEFVQKEIANK